MDRTALWERFKKHLFVDRDTGFALDISRIKFDDGMLSKMKAPLEKAFTAMKALEAGEIVNPDENRMVGHYWLRNPELAPDEATRTEIKQTLDKITTFAKSVHEGKIANAKGEKFLHVLVVGIGGSALGPQFVNQALSSVHDPMTPFFFDNTDPDGMEKVLNHIPDLSRTLAVIISKSGGTKETRNGQLVAKQAFKTAGLDFAKHFVAVTGADSELDKTAKSEGWLERFPMWDWVGGRTSEMSAVGLLPAALQGFDIHAILKGAAAMDALTRRPSVSENPAALMAACWYQVGGGGKGTKDMVVLPYKDRLELFSRYLQQLVMESLGKEKDLDGKVVNQGIAVYGNKGSTDQHAYVQQLRDGLANFFVVFVEVLKDRSVKSKGKKSPEEYASHRLDVEPGTTSGDFLTGFYLGTRGALFDSNRESISITLKEVDEYNVGMLIALFERTVGFYATLVNINAYHQPGVEAGKKAATEVLNLQKKAVEFLVKQKSPLSADEIAAQIGEQANAEIVFKVLRHLAANDRLKTVQGATVFDDKYAVE